MDRETTTIAAVWRPGWYELDQALEVGRTTQFAFFPPQPGADKAPLVFYNTLWKPQDAVAAWATVVRIMHPQLGELRKVDTTGLDYTFVRTNGDRLSVDAEEDPGALFVDAPEGWRRTPPTFDSWTLLVELRDMTPLRPAPERLQGP